MKHKPITQDVIDYALAHWDIDEVSGKVIWKVRKSKVKFGSDVGHIKKHFQDIGRKDIYVHIDGEAYLLSRIMYTIYFGKDPAEMEVDHIDRNPANNHKSNLRLVSHTINSINRKVFKNNKTGITGVYTRTISGKLVFVAQIGGECNRNKKSKRFPTLEQAIEQRKQWEIEYGYDKLRKVE